MDFSQKFNFDASQAIATINKLNKSLKSCAVALDKLAASAKRVNAALQSGALASYAANANKASQATKSIGSNSARAEQSVSRLKTRVDTAHKSLGHMHGSAGKASKGISALGKAATLVGGILVGQLAFRAVSAVISAFREAFTSAVELGNALAEVQTIGQNMLGSYDALTSKVIELSNAFGKSAQVTAEGLYQTLSNQVVEAGESFEFLATAQGLATVTASSTGDAVNALSSVLNVYGQEAGTAYEISSKLAKTVELGRLRLGEMANSLGKVYPLAHALGISFEEVMAALATMTRQGTKANVSITQLRGVFLKLVKPSEEMEAIFRKWGVETGQQAIETFGGLGGVIQKLTEETGGSSVEMAKLFTRVRSMAGALAINTKEGRMYAETLKAIRDEADFLNEALDKMSQSPARQLSLAYNEMKNSMIALAKEFIPFVTALVKGFTSVVEVINNMISALEKGYGYFQKIKREASEMSVDALSATIENTKGAIESLSTSWSSFVDSVPLVEKALNVVSGTFEAVWVTMKAGVMSVYNAFVSLHDYLMQFKSAAFVIKTVATAMNILLTGSKRVVLAIAGIAHGIYTILKPALEFVADYLWAIAPGIKIVVEIVRFFEKASSDAASSLTGFNAELQQFQRTQEEITRARQWKQYWASFKSETESSLQIIAAWSRAWDAAPDSVGRAINEIVIEVESLEGSVSGEAKSMQEALTEAFERPKTALEKLNGMMQKGKDAMVEYQRSLELSKLDGWRKTQLEASYALKDFNDAVDEFNSNPPDSKAAEEAYSKGISSFKKLTRETIKLQDQGKTNLAKSFQSQAVRLHGELQNSAKVFETSAQNTQKTLNSVAGKMATLDYKKLIAAADAVKKNSIEAIQELGDMSKTQRDAAIESITRELDDVIRQIDSISQKEWELLFKVNPDLVYAALNKRDYLIEVRTFLEEQAGKKIDASIKKQIGDAYRLIVEMEGEKAGQDFIAFIRKLESQGIITSELDLSADSLRAAFTEYNNFQKKIAENKQLTQSLETQFKEVRSKWNETLAGLNNLPAIKLNVDYGNFDQIAIKGKENIDQLMAMAQEASMRIQASLRSGEPIKLFDLKVLEKSVTHLRLSGQLTSEEYEKLKAVTTQANLLAGAQNNYNGSVQAGLHLQQQQQDKIQGLTTGTQQATTTTTALNSGFTQVSTSLDGVNSKIGVLPGKVDQVNSRLNTTATTNISQPLDNFSNATTNTKTQLGNLKSGLQTVNQTNISQPLVNFATQSRAAIGSVSIVMSELNSQITAIVSGPLAGLVQGIASINPTGIVTFTQAAIQLSTLLPVVAESLYSMSETSGLLADNFQRVGEFQPPDLSNLSEQISQIATKIGEASTALIDRFIPNINKVPPEVKKIGDAFNPVKDKITETATSLASNFSKAISSVLRNFGTMMGAIGSVARAIGSWPRAVATIYPAIRTAIGLMKQLKGAAEEALLAAQQASAASKARYGKYFAAGGSNRGQDTIPAQLSKGEFVVNADATRKFYSELVAMNSGAKPSYHSEGGNTTIGDIHVHVNQQETERQTVRSIASELKREIRRGTIKL